MTNDDKIWFGRKTVSYVPSEVCRNLLFVLPNSTYISHHKLTTRNIFWKHMLSVGWYLCWIAIWRHKITNFAFSFGSVISHRRNLFYLKRNKNDKITPFWVISRRFCYKKFNIMDRASDEKVGIWKCPFSKCWKTSIYQKESVTMTTAITFQNLFLGGKLNWCIC